jgi:hypothetical protein
MIEYLLELCWQVGRMNYQLVQALKSSDNRLNLFKATVH